MGSARLPAIVLGVSMIFVASACRAPKQRENFETDFAGAPAEISQEWGLQVPAGQVIGLPSGAAMCGDSVYFADPRAAIVHEFSLSTGTRVRTLSSAMPGGTDRPTPESVGVDCSTQQLFVVEQRAIVQIDLTSGAPTKRFPRPKSIGPALGTALVKDSAVVVPTFVNADGWLTRRPTEAFRGSAIGYRQPLDETEGQPMFPALSDSCRSISFDCLRISIDVGASKDSPWVACQSDGTDVGVYDAGGTMIRRINVGSPLFKSDGSSLEPGSQIPAKIAWSQRNSSIHGCYLLGPFVATVHSSLQPGELQPGKAMPPNVFLNVHSIEGRALLSDAKLADLPVAHDADSIYIAVMDEARSPAGSSHFRLQRMRLVDGAGALAAWTSRTANSDAAREPLAHK